MKVVNRAFWEMGGAHTARIPLRSASKLYMAAPILFYSRDKGNVNRDDRASLQSSDSETACRQTCGTGEGVIGRAAPEAIGSAHAENRQNLALMRFTGRETPNLPQ